MDAQQSVRVTVTLPRSVHRRAKEHSRGNLSRFVAESLRERMDALERRALRERLIAGYIAEAELDLQIVHEYRYVDAEAAWSTEVLSDSPEHSDAD